MENRELDRVKNFLIEKETAKQSTLSSTLKITPARLNDIISTLEKDGFLEKKKTVQNGHQINTVMLVKNELDKTLYKNAYKNLTEVEARCNGEKMAIRGMAIFESPCFFCNRLETCGEDSTINYYNCPRLNEWISKPL